MDWDPERKRPDEPVVARPVARLVDRHISRRLMVTALTILGGTAVSRTARAFTIEPAPSMIEPPPAREGILSWQHLAVATVQENRIVPSPHVAGLIGQEVAMDGYMLAVDERPFQTRFLISAVPAHCAFCAPGGMAQLVDVDAVQEVPLDNRRFVALRGRFDVRRDSDGSSPFYRLREARPA
jgi:hypothetical protein